MRSASVESEGEGCVGEGAGSGREDIEKSRLLTHLAMATISGTTVVEVVGDGVWQVNLAEEREE